MPLSNRIMATMLTAAIDNFSLETFPSEHRNHLGASQMGESCSRKLWYQFRWVKLERHTPRLKRLFDRGHREEPSMVHLLKGAGCQVWDYDYSQPPKADGTYPQYRVSGCKGHFGGSLDAIVVLPLQYEWERPISFSFKTSGTGSKFTSLVNKGLLLSKPEHHIQESIYCRKMGFEKYGYRCVNKNDDDHFITIEDADWKEADRQELRAEKIIFSRTPPAKVAANKSFSSCSQCHLSPTCQDNVPADEINCRSCKYAHPVDNGQWMCEYPTVNGIIPPDFIHRGCVLWSSIANSHME